jgi:hypothetical protein
MDNNQSKHETRSLELLFKNAIDLLAHLFGHVVLPVPNLAFPEERRLQEMFCRSNSLDLFFLTTRPWTMTTN